MKKKKSFLATVASLLLLAAIGVYDYMQAPQREILIEQPTSQQKNTTTPNNHAEADDLLMPPMPVILSEKRITHILYGDMTGGGHRYGAGMPCKSEFPKHWDDEKIINVTRKIAANDNLDWERQRNGYYVTEEFEGNVEVRVVKGPKKQRVITAYPVNAARNPCPL